MIIFLLKWITFITLNITSHTTVKVKTNGLRLSEFMQFLKRLGK